MDNKIEEVIKVLQGLTINEATVLLDIVRTEILLRTKI